MSLFRRQDRLSGWINLGVAVIAIGGIIIGAATVSDGTDQILSRYSIEGTVFGATVVTAVLTIEDLFLTVRPIRLGVPEIGIGNVIGSLIFSVTGKLGIVVLAGGSVAIGPSVLRWHLPALVVLTSVAACFLWTGRIKRWLLWSPGDLGKLRGLRRRAKAAMIGAPLIALAGSTVLFGLARRRRVS